MKVNFIIIITLIVSFFGCNNKTQTISSKESKTVTKKNSDTLLVNNIEKKVTKDNPLVEEDIINLNTIFKKAVQENEVAIEKYYALIQKFKKSGFDVKNRSTWEDQINKRYAKELKNVTNDFSILDSNLLVITKANKIDQVKRLQTQKEKLVAQKEEIGKTKKVLLKDLEMLETYKQDYQIAIKKIQTTTSNLLETVTFTYNKENYTAYIADLSKHKITTHLKKNNQHYSKLSTLKDVLNKEGEEVLMVTNAGMFHYTQNPVGLFIEEGEEKYKINLEPENGDNFHLAPNGVFYIDKKGAGIQKTSRFLEAYQTKKVVPISATQSGPMLVIDGKHHYKFNHGSKSRKLRSGVGLLPNDRIIFIISNRHNTNFFQFGTIFKDLFACQQALFLDGAISEMYIKGSSENLRGRNFGPMLSVTKK